jgi:hypothetical protein
MYRGLKINDVCASFRVKLFQHSAWPNFHVTFIWHRLGYGLYDHGLFPFYTSKFGFIQLSVYTLGLSQKPFQPNFSQSSYRRVIMISDCHWVSNDAELFQLLYFARSDFWSHMVTFFVRYWVPKFRCCQYIITSTCQYEFIVFPTVSLCVFSSFPSPLRTHLNLLDGSHMWPRVNLRD